MVYSMTGYGRAEHEYDGRKVTIEINSLNNRYCEIIVRLPKTLAHFESALKEIVADKVKRGKVLVMITIDESPEVVAGRLELNRETAAMYNKVFNALKEELDLPGEIDLHHFVGLPDLIKSAETELDEEKLLNEIKGVLRPALDDFVHMRKTEGGRLLEDIKLHVDKIENAVLETENSADTNVKLYNEKLKSRLKELLGDMSVSEEMIANEAAIVAEKSDITEECVRIKSHLEMFRNTYDAGEPVGKKMNFILQELYREANTIGSKSMSSDIARNVILMKEEIEKVREQVQNLE